jgi:tRNA nucleotidyltransferase (CCA-adding enzyme)
LHGVSVPGDNAPQLYLSLLAYRLILEEVDTLSARIRLAHDDASLMREGAALRDALVPMKTQDMSPSQVVHLLSPFSGPAILVNWVACDSARVRERLSRYWEEYRLVRPVLTGDNLRAMGLPPGPVYGRILEALRDARLDGRISSEEEERQIAEEWASRVQGRARGR